MSRFSLFITFFTALVMLAHGQDAATQATQAQAAPKVVFGSIDVDVRVEGKPYAVRFAPEIQTPEAVANELCSQKAQEIGVTQETLPNCVNGVAQYLQRVVDNWLVEKTLNVPVTIQDKRFDVRFLPEKQSPQSMATRLCSQNAELFQLTQETLGNCVGPVTDYLVEAVNRWVDEKTLQLPVTINGTTFEVAFLPERQNGVQMARKLCVENAAVLGITEENVLGCIEPVAQYLNNAVQRWVRSKTLQFNIDIDDKRYPFTMFPERQSAVNVAQEFCVNNAKEFGLTQETIVDKCINKLFGVIRDNVERWVDSKQLLLPIQTKDGKKLQVPFVPERETAETAARRFCVNQAATLGLTNENIVRECVAPVNNLLRQGIEQIIATQQAAAAAKATAEQPAAPPAAAATA